MDDFGEQKALLFAPTHIYGLYHQSVNVLLVMLQHGEIFIVSSQRSFEIFPFPGAYSVSVGGHIKSGESAIENAIQETREELGIEINSSRFIPIGNSHVGHQLFAKNWEYTPSDQTEPIKITQFDPAGKDLIISEDKDFPNKKLILEYVRSTSGSPLVNQSLTPEGLFLRNFNREYGFYYVVLLSSEEYNARKVNLEEVEKSKLISWKSFFQFTSALDKTADAFYTLTRDDSLRNAFVRRIQQITALA